MAPFHAVRLGMARTFQNIRLFGRLSVVRNVLVPILGRDGYGPLGCRLRVGRHAREAEKAALSQAMEILDFFRLAAQGGPAGSEPALRRAAGAWSSPGRLAAGPRLLLIDEPGAGMNPREIGDLLADIRQVKEAFGLTILMIEHQMGLVMNLSDRLVVLDFGEKIAEGAPAEVQEGQDGDRGVPRGRVHMLMRISGLTVAYGADQGARRASRWRCARERCSPS